MEEEEGIREGIGREGEVGRSMMDMMGGGRRIGIMGEEGGIKKEGEEELVMGRMEGLLLQAGPNVFASYREFAMATSVRITTRNCVLRIEMRDPRDAKTFGYASSCTLIHVTV